MLIWCDSQSPILLTNPSYRPNREIVTGLQPFQDEDLLQVAVDVRDNGRTVLTRAAPEVLAKFSEDHMELIKDCFRQDPKSRPTFAEIVSRLQDQAPKGYTEVVEEEGEADANTSNRTNRSKTKGGKRKRSTGPDPDAVEMQPGEHNYSGLPV